jgi:glutamyl-tRNA reductase
VRAKDDLRVLLLSWVITQYLIQLRRFDEERFTVRYFILQVCIEGDNHLRTITPTGNSLNISTEEDAYEELVSVPATRVGVIGVNFKTAPIEVREKLGKLVTIEALEKLQRENRSSSDIESLLLSTCNRVEVYFASEDIAVTRNLFTNLFLAESIDQNQKVDYHTYEYADERAIEHIFDVSSGLDSLIVGEAQILQQVKQASRVASEKRLSGPILAKLFSKAYTTGKEIREAYPRFTNGFKNSVSLSVVELIADHFRDRAGPNILLVGSGKMIKLAIGSLDNLSPNRVIVASRRNSPDSIQADKIIPISDIGKTIFEDNIDVIITATTSSDYVITLGEIEPFSKKENRQLLILDISVPRNADPRIAKLCPNVKLINLDDLKEIVTNPELEAEKSPERRKELASIHRSIEARTNEFMFWLKESSDITPVMAQLRKKADSIRAEELQNAISRLSDLSPEEKLVVQRMSERIIRRFLHEPTTNLKKVARNGESRRSREYASLLKNLFSLED